LSAAPKLPPSERTAAELLAAVDPGELAVAQRDAALKANCVPVEAGGPGRWKALPAMHVRAHSEAVAWLLDRGLACEWPRRVEARKPAPEPIPQGVPTLRYVAEQARATVAARPKPRLITASLDEVEPEEVEWLWPGRLPLGRVSGILGRQGAGKSTLLGWLHATSTSGLPWPDCDEPAESGSSILLQTEEVISQDIVPRLVKMGANMRRVHVVKAVERDPGVPLPFSLGRDVDALSEMVDRLGDVRLVTIDPLGSFVQGISGHNDSEVRALMQPLFDLAEAKNVAVILVMHPNKDGEKDILDRASNSGAFTQMARMLWYYSPDPKDKSRRILSLIKGNTHGATKTALAAAHHKGRLVWRPSHVQLDAFAVDHALQRAAREEKLHGKRGPDATAARAAMDFIADLVEKSGPLPVTAAVDQAEDSGIKESTFRKALRRLVEDDGRVIKALGEGGRYWLFPAGWGDRPEAPPVPAEALPGPAALDLDRWADDGGPAPSDRPEGLAAA
jgi:AAA domain